LLTVSRFVCFRFVGVFFVAYFFSAFGSSLTRSARAATSIGGASAARLPLQVAAEGECSVEVIEAVHAAHPEAAANPGVVLALWRHSAGAQRQHKASASSDSRRAAAITAFFRKVAPAAYSAMCELAPLLLSSTTSGGGALSAAHLEVALSVAAAGAAAVLIPIGVAAVATPLSYGAALARDVHKGDEVLQKRTDCPLPRVTRNHSRD